MKIIIFINEADVIRKILAHHCLWKEKTAVERAPPVIDPERTYEPFDDGWPHYEEPFVTIRGSSCQRSCQGDAAQRVSAK
jgi:hypothetical protein